MHFSSNSPQCCCHPESCRRGQGALPSAWCLRSFYVEVWPCPEATKTNTQTRKSVRLNTLRKGTKSAVSPKSRPNDAHGRRSTRFTVAAKNPAAALTENRKINNPGDNAEEKAFLHIAASHYHG